MTKILCKEKTPKGLVISQIKKFQNCLEPNNIKTQFPCYYANIKKIYIPSHVLMIRESSFGKCRKLSKVEIPTDSKLQTIGKFAFSQTNIRQIYIPSNISNINVSAFKFCDNLQIFEISEESKLEFLDKEIFETCKNVIIMIPPKMKKLINNNQ